MEQHIVKGFDRALDKIKDHIKNMLLKSSSVLKIKTKTSSMNSSFMYSL